MEKNRAQTNDKVLFDETIPREKENGYIVEANGEMKMQQRNSEIVHTTYELREKKITNVMRQEI